MVLLLRGLLWHNVCMKNIPLIFTITALLFLTSCSGGSNDGKKGESTKEVVDKYMTTLQTAPDKAKKVVSTLEKRGEAIDKDAEEPKP